MDIGKKAQSVDSKESFVCFITDLTKDWRQRHELIRRGDALELKIKEMPWKNYNCPDFLEAMQAWIADAAQMPQGISYRELAVIMAAAAGYTDGSKKETSPRLNCWEFKKCGREVGGKKVHELGICPAAAWDKRKNVNGGRFGGRMCWALVGTLCGGKVQGVFADKVGNCARCEFYQYVRKEEGDDFLYKL